MKITFRHNSTGIDFEFIGFARNMATVDENNEGDKVVVYKSIKGRVLYVTTTDEFKKDFTEN